MHTDFMVYLNNGTELAFTVEMEREALMSYLRIALQNENEVVEVFDIFQVSTLVPVRNIAHVSFGRVR